MLRTFPLTRERSWVYQAAGVGAFTLLMVVAARVSIPMEPVPFTLQPLAVLLAGMILGARGGALSQLAYLGLIALNLPVDANMRGALAFASPTAGFLVGFVVAAFVAGWLVEHGAARLSFRWLAGVAGIAVLYACGLAWLLIGFNMDFSAAWAAGAAPFLIPDMAKAVIAAALTESGRALLKGMSAQV